jgi:methionine-S-sulfoxide reductase
MKVPHSGITKIGAVAIAALMTLAGWKGLDAVMRPAPRGEITGLQGDHPMPRKIEKSKSETAIFAAGCFWGVEYNFQEVKGVKDTEVGYTGGKTKNPNYEQVCTDRTGHAEAVRVTFDPLIISYEDLVRFFFTMHDPTQLNRQGPDTGSQYRSAIFTANDSQKETARKVMEELRASGLFKRPIATEVVPASEFTRAEEYHQRYYEKNKIKSCGF